MKNKKKGKKKKFDLKKILSSYKTIIYISFLINIILIVFTYYTISNNKIYSFSGSDEYIEVKDGLIALNTDINLLNGNNISYKYNEDYDIVSFKIGYYVMDNKKLVEIISNNINLESDIKLSELVNNFSSFNVFEKNSSKNYFTPYKKKLLDDGLYLVLEAKTKDGNSILRKVKMNLSKISKF